MLSRPRYETQRNRNIQAIFAIWNDRLAFSAVGCQTLDGLGMLVNQGKIGVDYWAGISPDAGVMHKALMDVFEREEV